MFSRAACLPSPSVFRRTSESVHPTNAQCLPSLTVMQSEAKHPIRLCCHAERSEAPPPAMCAAHGIPRNARNDSLLCTPPCAVMQSKAKHPPAKARRYVMSCRAKRSIPLPSAPPTGFLAMPEMTACGTRRYVLSCKAKRSIPSGYAVMQSKTKHPQLRCAAHGIPRNARNDSRLYAPPYAVRQSAAKHPPAKVRCPWDSPQRPE